MFFSDNGRGHVNEQPAAQQRKRGIRDLPMPPGMNENISGDEMDMEGSPENSPARSGVSSVSTGASTPHSELKTKYPAVYRR